MEPVIILLTSTAGSVLQKSRRFGITKVKSIDLTVRILVIPLQSRNLMPTSVSCLPLLRSRISVFATSRLTIVMRTLWTWVMINPFSISSIGRTLLLGARVRAVRRRRRVADDC